MSTTAPAPARPTRRHRTMSEARDLVAAWRDSGMGKEPWCRARGILRSTLSSCLYRVDQAEVPAGSSAAFIAIRPPHDAEPVGGGSACAHATVAIELPGGVRITGLDAAGAATVIRQLREALP